MKYSFSTVGCPNWRWHEITAAARDLGYDGIELRGLGSDLTLTDLRIFSDEQIEKTAAELTASGLSVPCLASDCLLHNPDYDIAGVQGYISLAAALGAPYIRVLGDDWGWPGENADEVLVASRLKALAPAAEKAGVTLLMETSGVWADTAKLAALIAEVNSPAVRVLWDVHHPVRYFNETPAETYANIGQYVCHVHLKDSVMRDGKVVYKMLGYGDLPLLDALKLLKNGGYDGFLSMEWVKRWNEELEDAGIVFAHFIYEIKKLLGKI